METVCSGPEGEIKPKSNDMKSGAGKVGWEKAKALAAEAKSTSGSPAKTHKVPGFGLSRRLTSFVGKYVPTRTDFKQSSASS